MAVHAVRKILWIKYLAATSPSGWNSIDFPQNLLRILKTWIFHRRGQILQNSFQIPIKFNLKNNQEFRHILSTIWFVCFLLCKLTWLQVQPAPSACTPEMGGWWLTWELETWQQNPSWTQSTCSATYRKPLSSLMHSKVSPRRGLKGLWLARALLEPYAEMEKAATHLQIWF